MEYEKIILRALEPEDLELLYKWENNISNWAVSNTIKPFSRYALKKFLEDSYKTIYESGQLRLMIDHIPDMVTIGTIDIFDFDPYHNRAGIGILVAEENYRKKGYASMALVCLIKYCFETLHLHQVFCNIMANNQESIRLFKKHGFIQTGVRKEWIRSSEGYIDEHIFQLINSLQ
jgi:diamine N-acetyltransferase